MFWDDDRETVARPPSSVDKFCYIVVSSLSKKNNPEALREFLGYVQQSPVEQASFLLMNIAAREGVFTWAKQEILETYNKLNSQNLPLSCTT